MIARQVESLCSLIIRIGLHGPKTLRIAHGQGKMICSCMLWLHVDRREPWLEGVGPREEPMRKQLPVVCVVIACTILASIPPARAQQTGNWPRIGFLGPGAPLTAASCVPGFSEGLREHGWVEGQTIAIEYRWSWHAPLPHLRCKADGSTHHTRGDHAGQRVASMCTTITVQWIF
jgi:hypothetical protein